MKTKKTFVYKGTIKDFKELLNEAVKPRRTEFSLVVEKASEKAYRKLETQNGNCYDLIAEDLTKDGYGNVLEFAKRLANITNNLFYIQEAKRFLKGE